MKGEVFTMKRIFVALLVVGCSSSSTNETNDPPSDAGPDVLLWKDPLCQSVPSTMAFDCESESECMGYRCSRTYGKCVWPCASDCDCSVGHHCEAPACIAN